MSDLPIIITKLERQPTGYLTARVSVNGTTVPVTRRFGSWTTVPDERGATRDLLRPVSRVLQERARRFERAEQAERNARDE